MLLIGCERIGTSPAETAIIGDRLDTDIVGGRRAGLQTLAGADRRLDRSTTSTVSDVKPD